MISVHLIKVCAVCAMYPTLMLAVGRISEHEVEFISCI